MSHLKYHDVHAVLIIAWHIIPCATQPCIRTTLSFTKIWWRREREAVRSVMRCSKQRIGEERYMRVLTDA